MKMKQFRNKKGISVSIVKLKNIYNELPDEFTCDDVKIELDKYRALTEVAKSTVRNYIKDMKKIKYIESVGIKGALQFGGGMVYKKIGGE